MSLPTPLHYLLKAIEWLGFVVLVALFSIVVSPLLPTRKIAASYAVVTGSMEPYVPVGALALVREVPISQLKIGDVIAFNEPGNPKRVILHRIVDTQTTGTITEFKTKGDNNQIADSWTVSSTMVRGKLTNTIPELGKPILFAQQPLGFALMIGLPAVLLALLQIRTIYQGIQELVEQRAQALATSLGGHRV